MEKQIRNKAAKFAFEQVLKLENQKEFRSLARSFPSMLQKNGLGSAVLFLYSKKGKSSPHKFLYDILCEWLYVSADSREKDLMKQIVNMNSVEYRIATNKAMELCLWIKRFAEGMMSKDGQ